ncbi:ABC transporter ATP-binding protein [Pseudonocardia lutea]|uniref:ABC transporter ATP-binding protein n=1 Tax=Pseudonocardia lutea TaxID=2172015 RepID=A0ABW1I9V7_9PSEU
MLEITDLHVHHGTTHAVRGVDLTVGAGESVALLGPNGAGKTSLLRAVSGLVDHTGTVRFAGTDLAGASPEEIARRGLLHVPEGRRIFRDLSVHENLLLGTTARGRRSSTPVEAVYDLFPALVPLRSRLGFALSGGEQQMVAIGRALVGGPSLVMLDEPSLGLAPVVVDLVADALAAIRDSVSLLVIEQNVALAARLCDRALVLSGGTVVLERPAAELGSDADLLADYLGRA